MARGDVSCEKQDTLSYCQLMVLQTFPVLGELIPALFAAVKEMKKLIRTMSNEI